MFKALHSVITCRSVLSNGFYYFSFTEKERLESCMFTKLVITTTISRAPTKEQRFYLQSLCHLIKKNFAVEILLYTWEKKREPAFNYNCLNILTCDLASGQLKVLLTHRCVFFSPTTYIFSSFHETIRFPFSILNENSLLL